GARRYGGLAADKPLTDVRRGLALDETAIDQQRDHGGSAWLALRDHRSRHERAAERAHKWLALGASADKRDLKERPNEVVERAEEVTERRRRLRHPSAEG